MVAHQRRRVAGSSKNRRFVQVLSSDLPLA